MSDFYVNKEAINLLCKACFIDDIHFMCFGKFYSYLKKFEFIDKEYNVTYSGKQFVRYYLSKKEESSDN